MSSRPHKAEPKSTTLSGGMKLAVRRPESRKPEIHEVAQPFAVIGRADECDLSLASPEVSFRHAYVQRIGKGYFCIDLGSRTGTHWSDGQRNFGWLSERDSVQVGPFQCSLAEKESKGSAKTDFGSFNPLEHYSGQLGPMPAVEIEFLNGSPSKPVWRISRMITLVGSSRRCKFRLEDESVSTFHCSLVLAPDGLWVVDLLGKGGTRVGRSATRCALLKDEQKIRIGKFLMRIRYRESAPRLRSEPLMATMSDEPDVGAYAAGEELAGGAPPTAVGIPVFMGPASDTDIDLPPPNLAEEWRTIQARQSELDASFAALETERRELAVRLASVSEAEKAVASAREELQAMQATVQMRDEGVSRREQSLFERESSLVEREDEIADQQKRIEIERNTLETRAADLAAAEHLRSTNLRELSQQEEQLKVDLAALEERQQKVEAQRQEQSAESEALSKARVALAEERNALESLREELAVEKTRLAELRRQADARSSEFAITEAALFKQRELLVREREALAAEKSRWRSELADSRNQAEQLAREDRALIDRRSDLEKQFAEVDELRSAVEAEQRELVQERTQLQSDQRHFAREKGQIEQNLAELFSTHQTREANIAELERQLAAQRDELAELRKSLETQRLEIAREKELQVEKAGELLSESRLLERQRKEIASRAAELAEQRAALKAEQIDVAEDREKIDAARRWLREKRASILAERAELQRQRAELDSNEKTPVVELEFVDPLPADPLELTLHNQVFKTERDGTTLIVTMQGDSGKFHYVRVQTEANKVRRLVDGTTFKDVLIDFSGSEFFGNIIISVVVMLARQSADRGGRAAFCAAAPQTLQLLEAMRLIDLWPYFPTREEALAWIDGAPQ